MPVRLAVLADSTRSPDRAPAASMPNRGSKAMLRAQKVSCSRAISSSRIASWSRSRRRANATEQSTSRPRRGTRRTSVRSAGTAARETARAKRDSGAKSAGTPTTPTRTPRGIISSTARRRNTASRSGGPGRRRLLQSAKLAGATRSGHRRKTGAAPRGGNGTPDQGRPRLPKGACRPSLRRMPRRVRPRQQQLRNESWHS